MKFSMSFVAIRKIKPSVSRWNFSDHELDRAARLLMDVDGVINPLVLRREGGLESYEVIDGNFEYYAAARANEIDPRWETIGVFIIEPEQEKAIQEQIKLLRPKLVYAPRTKQEEWNHPTDLESRVTLLESRQTTLETQQMQLELQTIRDIKTHLEELHAQLNRRNNLLDLFNDAEIAELLDRMKRVGLTGKNAEKVIETIEHERQERRFGSLKDVVTRVKGLTYERIVELIEV
ncbi:MAG: DUF655 domain-containing protein [Cyanobacteria bacterium CRU_2_1]|nr:DUF655 domain-containing protein [Cyanobacteria bacterium RU_5_0]NJR63519.1 DUF655 domain-containing protein [Cyanobacteria bacterium CRU_2_1]